jgi:hypothetical protein
MYVQLCAYVHVCAYVHGCAYVHVCAEYAYGYVIVYVYNIFVQEHVYTRICAYVHIYIDDRCTCLVELVFFKYWVCLLLFLRQKLGDSDVDLAKCGIGFTCRKGLKPESPNQADG